MLRVRVADHVRGLPQRAAYRQGTPVPGPLCTGHGGVRELLRGLGEAADPPDKGFQLLGYLLERLVEPLEVLDHAVEHRVHRILVVELPLPRTSDLVIEPS